MLFYSMAMYTLFIYRFNINNTGDDAGKHMNKKSTMKFQEYLCLSKTVDQVAWLRIGQNMDLTGADGDESVYESVTADIAHPLISLFYLSLSAGCSLLSVMARS